MKGSSNNSFQTMLIAMLAIYALFFNVMWQSGALPPFDIFHYAKRPINTTHYSLKFFDINGQSPNEPLYLDAPNDWIDDRERYDALDLVNKLGIAVYDGDFETAEQLHDQLVSEYFINIDSATYELVLRVVNPVEKYTMDGHETIVDQVMQRYEFHRQLVTN